MDDRQIAEIVRRVMSEMSQPPAAAQTRSASAGTHVATCAGGAAPGGRDGVFDDIDDAINAAAAAQQRLYAEPFDLRYKLVEAMRSTGRAENERLSKLAVQDTNMGRYDHKMTKNNLAIEKTPGPEELKASCDTGDKGITVHDYAPFGVIGTITPCTNPIATVINHAIAMVSAGNSVVFAPHPSAIQCTLEAMQVMNRAMVGAGGPANLLTSVTEPSLRTAKIVMKHEKVNLLVATGGPSVVKAAMGSGKRAICAGPGNPPVIVDETADLRKAAAQVHSGASFDNNMPCICEKEVFVVREVAEQFVQAMQEKGAYLLSNSETEALVKVVVTDDGHINRDFVGKDAPVLLRSIGINPPANLDLIICQTNFQHPLVQHEQLMPVLPIVTVANYDEAVDLAKKAEHGFGHTAIIHSQRVDRITHFAKTMQCSLFVANGACGACLGNGGEGITALTIAGPTGEGTATPVTFSKRRRMAVVDGAFRIV